MWPGLAQEIVRGLPVIQALGGERQARERFRQLNARSLRAGQQATRVAAAMERTLRIVHGAATAVVVGVGALLVLARLADARGAHRLVGVPDPVAAADRTAQRSRGDGVEGAGRAASACWRCSISGRR